MNDEPYLSAMHFLYPKNDESTKEPRTINDKSDPKPCIFLDRDGTINVEIEYLHEPSKFQFIPGVIPALRLFSDHGYKLIVITNQGAIHRGRYTHEDVKLTHEFMIVELKKENIQLDGIYYCPHASDEQCSCRKPMPGMILQAAKDHGIDLSNSWMIGDKLSDIEAGNRAGVFTILLLTGYGKEQKEVLETLNESELNLKRPTFIAENLEIAEDLIVGEYIPK